jgi:uncharacterized membrane protein YdjX (TVP38/TMEM64 family)
MPRFENWLDRVHSLRTAMMPTDGRVPTALPLGAWQRAARLAVLGLVAGGVVTAWRWKAVLDPMAITVAIGRYPAAPLAFIAVHIAASLVFVPRTLLAIVAGLLFGAFWGIVWGVLGSIAGAVMGFLVARYLGSGLIRFQRATRITPLLERIERGGWRAVTLLRLIPIIPHSLANFGLGLTRLPLGAYTLGSLIGQLPLTIAYAELGAAGERLLIGGAGWLQPTLIGLAVLSLSLLSPGYFNRRSRRPVRKADGWGPPVAQSRSSTVCTIGTGQPPAS